jgi:hypothetical protein
MAEPNMVSDLERRWFTDTVKFRGNRIVRQAKIPARGIPTVAYINGIRIIRK